MEIKVSFSISGYDGYEDEVLHLRNRNRPEPQTRDYMDWRFLGQKTSTPPLIFWVHDENGKRVGMAAIIFRPYWVNNRKCEFAVLGDISLAEKLRGKGIAKKLFQFINSHIEKESVTCGFVIPNIAAQKSLLSVNWQNKELLVHYVFYFDLTEKFNQKLKNHLLANLLGYAFLQYKKLRLLKISENGLQMETVKDFDDSFDSLWQDLQKENIIIRDRSRQMLNWRYANHPNDSFKIIKFHEKNKMIGYLVYTITAGTRTCVIYDLMALNNDYVKVMLSQLIHARHRDKEVVSIRFTLNKCHPYTNVLKRVGFIGREEEKLFQIYTPTANEAFSSYIWCVSSGDKDV